MMANVEYEVRAADAGDVADITRLLRENSPDQGGTLTGSFPADRVRSWIEGETPVLVACKAGRLIGVLATSAREQSSPGPYVASMLVAYSAQSGSYVYGPVCVDGSERGRGVLGQLYAELRRRMPDREAILFIREDNATSLKAHARLGMHRVGSFRHADERFAVLSSSSSDGLPDRRRTPA